MSVLRNIGIAAALGLLPVCAERAPKSDVASELRIDENLAPLSEECRALHELIIVSLQTRRVGGVGSSFEEALSKVKDPNKCAVEIDREKTGAVSEACMALRQMVVLILHDRYAVQRDFPDSAPHAGWAGASFQSALLKVKDPNTCAAGF